MPADENGFTNEWCGISREEALKTMIDFSEGEGLLEIAIYPRNHNMK